MHFKYYIYVIHFFLRFYFSYISKIKVHQVSTKQLVRFIIIFRMKILFWKYEHVTICKQFLSPFSKMYHNYLLGALSVTYIEESCHYGALHASHASWLYHYHHFSINKITLPDKIHARGHLKHEIYRVALYK